MAFPQELTLLRRWVCWRLSPDKNGGKARKIPYNPETGRAAKAGRPETWSDYRTAYEALKGNSYSGLGFQFMPQDGYVGVDVDHCFNPMTGEFNEVATAIMARQKTYMELSPSGDGIHIWYRGKKPGRECKNQAVGVEMYDAQRFLTMTGRQLEGTPDEVAQDNGALQWIYDTYLKTEKAQTAKSNGSRKKRKPPKEALSDEDVIRKATEADDGGIFRDLFEGKWQGHPMWSEEKGKTVERYGSQSEADMALALKLAFWTAKDPEQIDRIFRHSKLMRPKWDERHRGDGTTYGQEVVAKAIELTEDVYNPDDGLVIFEYAGKYFRAKGDNVYPVTNFLFEPVEMILGEEEAQITTDLVTVRGEKIRLSMMTSDLANSQKFKNLLSKKTMSLGYFGGDGDMEFLKEYMSQLEWRRKVGVKAMGVHLYEGQNVFVTVDGAMDKHAQTVDGIVQMEKYKSITSEIMFCNPISTEEIKTLLNLLVGYGLPQKTIPVLGWCGACFVKTKLKEIKVRLPHLFLTGEAGSGKSTTIKNVIQPMFSEQKVFAAGQVTNFTLMKDAASSNLVPYLIDEFKPSKMDRPRINNLYNFLRSSYDGQNAQRGRADLSEASFVYAAPVVVAGEESADETAIRERTIEVLYSKKDHKNLTTTRTFNALSKKEDAVKDLGRTLLLTALGVNTADVKGWYNAVEPTFSKDMPSRVINNMACCVVGLRLIERMLSERDVTWDDVFPYTMDQCARYIEEAEREYLLDYSVHNKSIIEETFEIMARIGLDPKNDYFVEDGGKVLCIWLSGVYDRYTKYRRDHAIVGEVLSAADFQKQLRQSDVLIEASVLKRVGSMSRRMWVVNLEMLAQRCDVTGFLVGEATPMT